MLLLINYPFQSVSAQQLRHDLVQYLENQPIEVNAHYCEFLVDAISVPEHNRNDVEHPDVQDMIISEIEQTDTQQLLRWQLFIQRLADGAWANHIAIQGISNMLNLSIHILNSTNGSFTSSY